MLENFFFSSFSSTLLSILEKRLCDQRGKGKRRHKIFASSIERWIRRLWSLKGISLTLSKRQSLIQSIIRPLVCQRIFPSRRHNFPDSVHDVYCRLWLCKFPNCVQSWQTTISMLSRKDCPQFLAFRSSASKQLVGAGVYTTSRTGIPKACDTSSETCILFRQAIIRQGASGTDTQCVPDPFWSQQIREPAFF